MKKLNFKMAFMMAAVVIGSPVFTSCSNDDDNDSAGGGMTSKHIVKMTWSDEYGYTKVTTFDYDSQGRVVKKTRTSLWGGTPVTTTYTYEENTIISETPYDDNEGDFHIYTLSNGRIIKDVYESIEKGWRGVSTYEYTYDRNGYMTSQICTTNYNDTHKTEFTWIDGNLTKYSQIMDDGRSYIYNISYSNIPWPQNWMQYWTETLMDEALEPLGVWGKMPKNLPNKFIDIDSTEDNDYTIEDGLIIKVISKISNHDGESIYTFEWK